MDEEIISRIALRMIPGIGDLYAKLLTEFFSGASNVLKATRKELVCIPGVGDFLLNQLTNVNLKHEKLVRAENELKFVIKNNISVLLHDEEKYPKNLKECDDGPFLMYLKGGLDLNAKKTLAIVGTRKATGYGEDITAKLIQELAGNDITIVSGLAYGIDTYAHQGALKNKLSTVAVLAHGLDRIYPQQNLRLSNQMLEDGGLLTDFMSGTNPDRENFPKRNRIVAGMCDATLVVEGTIKGGALITAKIANSYGREVMAVPGRSIDPYSGGCNWLIKEQRAALVENAADIISVMNWKENTTTAEVQLNLFQDLTDQERNILEVLKGKGRASKEQISFVLGVQTREIAEALFNMELNGYIKCLPGNSYQLKVI